MPLQTGFWKINSSGTLGSLAVNSVDVQGNVQGELTSGGGPNPIVGFWDELSAKLTFVTTQGTVVAYTGYLSTDQFRMPGITGGIVSTLTGYYIEFGGLATTDKSVFGWYAQIGQA